MVDYDYRERFKDYFGRIFYLSILSRLEFIVITDKLSDSYLLKSIERNDYSVIMNLTPEEMFTSIFNLEVTEDSFLKYNDAYWCGYVYAELFYRVEKTFPYIFLVLPLDYLLSKYDVYHEMDISQIIDYFHKREDEETILTRLIKKRKITITELSELSGVPLQTLKKYKKSNEHIYGANFTTIKKIAAALEVDDRVFLKQ